MTVAIYDIDLRKVKQSKNLRCIMDYSRGMFAPKVQRVDIFANKSDSGGTLGVMWDNGATCCTGFASVAVLREWVKARRIFRNARIIDNANNI